MWQLSAWQTKRLLHIAKSTRTRCRIAYKDWALMRVDEFIQRFNALNEVLFFVAFGYNPIEKVSY